jgi:KilA-N domain
VGGPAVMLRFASPVRDSRTSAVVDYCGQWVARGTWLHPKLATRFGIWVSDEFGYLVEEWVEQWLTAGLEPNYDESLIATITAAIEQALTPINQQLSEIQQQLKLFPGAKPKRSTYSTFQASIKLFHLR